MRFSSFRFVPTLWPSLLFLVLMPLFIALGVWQLNRAAEKILILENLESNKNSTLKKIESIDVNTDENSSVLLSGSVLNKQQFLLDNKVYRAVVGYEVFTPIQLDDTRIVLVNRGWVAQGPSRSELPNVELEESTITNVSGLFVTPSKGYTIGEALDVEMNNWPKVIQFLDYKQIGRVLNEPVIEGVVLLDEPLGKQHPRLWKPIAFGPEKHYGYAAQWFAIALALLVLYIVLNTKKEERY